METGAIYAHQATTALLKQQLPSLASQALTMQAQVSAYTLHRCRPLIATLALLSSTVKAMELIHPNSVMMVGTAMDQLNLQRKITARRVIDALEENR